MSDSCSTVDGMDTPPLTVLPQATDALDLTLRLTPEEIDPRVLEVRARAIATPVIVSELRRLAAEFLDEHDRDADHLNEHAETLDRAEFLRRHSVNEAVRAVAAKLAGRADELNEQARGT